MTSALPVPSEQQWAAFNNAVQQAGMEPIPQPQHILASAGYRDGIIYTGGITPDQLEWLTDLINNGWRPGRDGN